LYALLPKKVSFGTQEERDFKGRKGAHEKMSRLMQKHWQGERAGALAQELPAAVKGLPPCVMLNSGANLAACGPDWHLQW